MAEPGLQFEQGHRLFGVVELAGDRGAGPMARDAASGISSGHAGLATEDGDEGLIEVVPGDPLGPQAEEEWHELTGARIEQGWLGGTGGFPHVNRLAHDWVDRLGERRAGLVGGHVEQADAVGAIRAWLPADTADPQANEFIATQAAEQPRDDERPYQFHRIAIASVAARCEISVVEVEPGPQEFRPQIIGDDAGVRADQGLDRPGRGQGARRIEAPGDPAPFLAVAEELAHDPEVVVFRSGRQWLPESVPHG